MALPQQVLEKLNAAPQEQTPGWSWGLLSFTGGILLIALVVYFGMVFGYEPYLHGQIADLNTQLSAAAKSISPSDQAQLVTTYSQAANLQRILTNHVLLSHFLTWLEKNTEANIYYTRFSLVSRDQISLAGFAVTEADVNQQLAILEASPMVKSANLSSVSLAPDSGKWQFNISLVMKDLSSLTP